MLTREDRLVAMQASIDGIKESVDDLKNSMDRQFAQLTATIQAQARGANQLLSPVPNDSGTLPPQGLLPATWDSLERLNSDRTNRLLQFYALDVTGNLVSRRRRLAEYLRSTTQ